MDTIRLTLIICLAYGYVRLVYELVQAGWQAVSLPHLVGLIIGAHGIWLWRSRQTAGHMSGVAANADIPVFLVVLLVMTLLADAGVVLIGL